MLNLFNNGVKLGTAARGTKPIYYIMASLVLIGASRPIACYALYICIFIQESNNTEKNLSTLPSA